MHIILLNCYYLQTGRYLLLAEFHSYKNSLHSYLNMTSDPIMPQCCDGRETPNCTEPCNTFLNYCFKEIGTGNNFTNDAHILEGCLDETRSLTQLMEPMDHIDFSDPPLTEAGTPTWSTMANRDDIWKVK